MKPLSGSWGVCPWVKRRLDHAETPGEKTVPGHSKDTYLNAKERALAEINPADTLIFGCEIINAFLFSKLPRMWYFVMTSD